MSSITPVLGLFFLGCTGGGKADDTAGGFNEYEASAGAAASTASVTLQESLVFVDVVLFNFDPDLNNGSSAEDNAATLQSNAGGDGGCATITPSGATSFSVDFGTGCTYGSLTVSGAVTVSVGAEGGEGSRVLTVDLVMTALVVNTVDLDGTASFSTENGSTLAVALDLTHSGSTVAADLTVVGVPGSFTMDGSATVTANGASTSLVLTGVHITQGACWADAGSIAADMSGATGTLTFDGNTPSTGQATFSAGRLEACWQLSDYGTCVATACPE